METNPDKPFLSKFLTIALIALVTVVGIASYKTNMSAKVSTTESGHVYFDQHYLTSVEVFRSDSGGLIMKDCQKVNIGIRIEGDTITLKNLTLDSVFLKGIALGISENKATLSAVSINLKTPQFFSLTKYIPSKLDDTDLGNELIIVHIGPKEEPSYILCKKESCQDMMQMISEN